MRTRVFEIYDGHYRNLTELAAVMGISVSQVYRVREGSRGINQKFIVGALKAFPDYTLDELFYVTTDSPSITENDSRPYTISTSRFLFAPARRKT